jgi:protein-disulfide isomerase
MVKTNKRRDDERRSTAAAKVAQMRQAQLAAERRRRSLIISGIVVAVVVVVVLIAVIVSSSRTSKTVGGHVGGSNGHYGFVLGKASAPVSVVLYEDFQCPICQAFEHAYDKTLTNDVKAGTISVEYRPIAFLDRMSSTDYSTRALNAAVCVNVAGGKDAFKKYHDILYQNQPKENTAGLPDSQLVTFAGQAGVSKSAVSSCIEGRKYQDWTVSATAAASRANVTGTPTVRINGQDFTDLGTPGALQDAIDKAKASR